MVKIPEQAVQEYKPTINELLNELKCRLESPPEPDLEELRLMCDATIAALTEAAPHMSGVKVKPLEWEDHPAGGIQALAAGIAIYRVHANGDDWYMLPDHMGKGGKAAAQADYEKRILSALEPSSAREQALEEAAQWYEKQRQKWLEMNIGLPDFAPEIRALKSQPAPQTGDEDED